MAIALNLHHFEGQPMLYIKQVFGTGVFNVYKAIVDEAIV